MYFDYIPKKIAHFNAKTKHSIGMIFSPLKPKDLVTKY